MTKFLTQYVSTVKSNLVESQSSPFVRVNNVDYQEARAMSLITILLSTLDGLTTRKFLLINNRFGPEVVFKKWLLFGGAFVMLLCCLI